MNLNKHIWEGWTVQSFIDEIQPMMDMSYRGNSIQKFPATKTELKKYLKDNQPNYKKHIPELFSYFCVRYNVK